MYPFGALGPQTSKWRIWSRILTENRSIWIMGTPCLKMINLIKNSYRTFIDTNSLQIASHILHFEPRNSRSPNRHVFYTNRLSNSSRWALELQKKFQIDTLSLQIAYQNLHFETGNPNVPNRYLFFTDCFSYSSLWALEPQNSKPLRFVCELLIEFFTLNLGPPKLQIATSSVQIAYQILHVEIPSSKAPIANW